MKEVSELSEIDKLFKKHLPDSLYLNHYQLAEELGYSPQQWKKYLKENRQFIDAELAEVTEAEARAALKHLTNPNSTQNVTALKELIAKSNLLTQKHNQKPTTIITYIPEKLAEQKRIAEEEYRRSLEDF